MVNLWQIAIAALRKHARLLELVSTLRRIWPSERFGAKAPAI